MSQPVWMWDGNRQLRYYWCAEERCYKYEDNTTVYPQHTSNLHAGAGSAYVFQDLSQAFGSMTIGTGGQPSTYQSTGSSQYASTGQAFTPAGQHYHAQTSSSWTSHSQARDVQGSLQTEPQEEIADKELLDKGIPVRGKIKGTKGDSEKLDKRYCKQPHGRKFFRVGKVIKILWPELPGNMKDGMTVVTDPKFPSENFFTKIRWFVVVKEGKVWCTCVPIATYGQQGCTKSGIEKWQHCIVYCGKEEPEPLQGESPRSGESPMLSAIRVRPKEKGAKMQELSRINFSKMYTVEHNVKVFDFGDVEKEYRDLLVEQWRYVLDRDSRGVEMPRQVQSNLNRVQEEEESEEEEEVEPEPSTLPIHGTAGYAWNAANTSAGQLVIQSNDRIYVTEQVDNDWGRGRNERTGQEGLFPWNYVTLDSGDFAIVDIEYPATKPGHLRIRPKDRIVDIEHVDFHWDKGRNKRTKRTGLYPHSHVRLNRGAFVKALYAYLYDENKPDQLVFDAGDWILVTQYEYTSGWSWGRHEKTRREGKFPTTYISYVQ